MKQVFPKEILESTSEVFLFKHRKGSRFFLWILLLFVGLIISLLPFLEVDVYSSAKGIIRSEFPKTDVNVIVSANVLWNGLWNNRGVCKGDTLLILDGQNLPESLSLNQYKIELTENFRNDLNLLVTVESVNWSELYTEKYKKMFIDFLEKKKANFLDLERLKVELKRSKILFSKGVISEKEYRNVEFEYRSSLSRYRQLIKEFNKTCEQELINQEEKLKNLLAEKKQLLKEKQHYIITSPTNGTLNQVSSISGGNYVMAGTKLAEISPTENLLIECYISPFDIGFIKRDMKTHFQIDAFNYNQWGIVTGSVLEIGQDLQVQGTGSFFKVKCQMNQQSLSLKNGFKGVLKKGMTVNAHFIITRRSLIDLLYDQIDDWFIPSSQESLVTFKEE